MMKRKSQRQHNFLLISMAGWLAVMGACQPDPDDLVLNPDMLYMSDTMYARQRLEVIKKWDSICEVHTDSLVAYYRDSLLQKELQNIKSLSE